MRPWGRSIDSLTKAAVTLILVITASLGFYFKQLISGDAFVGLVAGACGWYAGYAAGLMRNQQQPTVTTTTAAPDRGRPQERNGS